MYRSHTSIVFVSGFMVGAGLCLIGGVLLGSQLEPIKKCWLERSSTVDPAGNDFISGYIKGYEAAQEPPAPDEPDDTDEPLERDA